MDEKSIIIKLELPLTEINQIMIALGKQPYEAVESVVASIRQQTYPQLPKAEDTSTTDTPAE
jgi:hypothetical protein